MSGRGCGSHQISDQEVSRSAGQSFLNFAMKVLPRCNLEIVPRMEP
jgi:hypothetical protein